MRTNHLLLGPVIALSLGVTSASAEEVPAAMDASAVETSAAASAATPGDAKPRGEVARALFTLTVRDREPGEAVTRVPADAHRVHFFTELRGLEGQRVVHRWEHAGAVLAEVAFDVRGPRWRVHSSKQLLPGWAGRWTVKVVDGAGNILREESFAYEEPRPAAH